MITVTGRDTCKAAYIDEKNIDRIEERSEEIDGRLYSYSRIYVKDPKQQQDFYLDVVESVNKISQLIKAVVPKKEIPKGNI